MGFSLRNLVQGAKKTAGQVVHNVAPSTVAGVVNRNVAQPVNRAVVQPTTRLVSRAVDQANPLDNNRTWQQRTPTNNNSVKEQRNKAAYNIVAGTGVRAVRSVTGLAQMGSGLYDLASPGTGTSRVSQGLDKFAKFTDAKAKSKGVNTAYQATALPMELLGFKGVATGVGKAVSKGPKYVQNASKGIDKFVDAKTAGLSKKGPAGAIASSSLRGGFKVQNQVADKAFVAKFTGENASRGRDTSPKTVATDVLLGDLMNFGLPASGQAIRQGVKAVKPVTKAATETAKKAKYNYDKYDPGVRELDRQYDQLNKQWQQATPKSRKDIEGAILANRAARDETTRRQIGGSLRSVGDKPEPQRSDTNSLQSTPVAGVSKVPTTKLVSAVRNGEVSSNGSIAEPTATSVGRNPSSVTPNQTQEMLPQVPESVSLPQPLARTESPVGLQSSQLSSSLDNTTIPQNVKVSLNTSRLNVSEDARKALSKETSDTVARMSNDDIQRVAKSAGIDIKSHTAADTRKKIAEQLNVRQDAIRLLNEAEVAKNSGDLNLAEQLLKESAERGRISRTQGTDLARQLQARKIIANELDSPQQRIFKLLDNANVNQDVYVKRLAKVDFNNAEDVVKAYRELVPAKAGQWLDLVRYNSMLSSPLTHLVNIGSNALNVGVVAPIEKTVRGLIDATGSIFGRPRTYAAGEGGAYAAGVATNLRNATSQFVEAMRGKVPENFNLDIDEYATPLALGGAKGATYQALAVPTRLLGASDKFFRALAEAGEERALTLRASKGIEIKGNTKELAKGEADYRVYQQDTDLPGQGPLLNAVDSVTNSIMDLRRTQVWAKFVFPFVKTPTNILKQGIEFSPLGAVNAIGAEDKITAITRAAVGTAVFGASWAMVANGDATWGEPRNPEEKARFKAEGKQPYSFKIGDKWVNFSKLPPAVSFPFALTAGIDDAIKNKKMDENQAKAIFTGIAKYGEFLGDQSYLKNIGDTLGAFEGDPDKAVQAFANYPQQVVPLRALTGWLARMTDDKERKINNDAGFIDKQVQSLIMNYPGLRQKVGTRDYRGEPIPANNPVLNSFSPFKITDDRGTNPLDSIKDQAKQESQKLPELTTAQTKEYKSLAASQVDKAQNTLSRSREFQSLNTVDKAKALESVKTKINSAYKRTYMQERDIPLTKQPSKSDVKIISGKSAPSDYISKGSRGGSSTSIAPNITPHSKKVLDEYSTLDTATRNKKLASEPDYEWKVAKSKYENDKASGKISSVQDIDRQKKLAKLEIGKPYSKEARDLFGKSKADVYEYITNAKNGEQLASEIKAYDQALFEAGLVKYATFQKSIAPAKGGGGRKTTKGGAKYTSKSGTGSKKSGGKGKTAKGSTKGTIKDFSELYAFAQPKTTTSSLRKLLADAKVTKR